MHRQGMRLSERTFALMCETLTEQIKQTKTVLGKFLSSNICSVIVPLPTHYLLDIFHFQIQLSSAQSKMPLAKNRYLHLQIKHRFLLVVLCMVEALGQLKYLVAACLQEEWVY